MFLWKSLQTFFQSRDKAPMTRAQTCSGEPGAGGDGWQVGTANGEGEGWEEEVSACSWMCLA